MIGELVRPAIRALKPYSSARDEFSGKASVFVDANENPYNAPLNRYPDPLALDLKGHIAAIKGVEAKQIFTGNGSDEAIDLLIRIFCEPGKDEILMFEPTYGMYQVCAAMNDVACSTVPLDTGFQPDPEKILGKAGDRSKLLFLCSPNNPSANSYDEQAILLLLRSFRGLVVLDEAYIDFSAGPGFLQRLNEFPKLVILQTLSKAWGLAGVRVGMAFAQEEIIHYMNRVKYPYNVNVLSQKKALEALENPGKKDAWVQAILMERTRLESELNGMPAVEKVFPSDANFLLVKFRKVQQVFHFLVERGIVVRDRSNMSLCEGCLRITVGTEKENTQLLETLRAFSNYENKL